MKDINIKFEDYPFKVPNIKKVSKKLDAFLQEIKDCKTALEADKFMKHFGKYMEEISTEMNLIYVLYSIDTRNPDYVKAIGVVDEIGPIISNYATEISKVLVHAPYRPELEKKYGEYLFIMYENSLKTFNEKVIPDVIEENKLSSKYDEIMGSAQIEFRGETLNLSQLGKHMKSADREERKEAAMAMDKWLGEHEQALGELYGNLVTIRTRIAKTLGFDSFTDLAYLRMGRTDYNPEMVKGYRDQITKAVTPLCNKLYKEQAKRLGIRNPQSFDYNLMFKSGNPTPRGDSDHLVKVAMDMYDKMSKETSVFFRHMIDLHLVDLVAKPGKAPGGYCTYFSKYQTPFVFSNFNGTLDDVNVLTHEMGHGFQMYSSRVIKVPEYRDPGMETAEIHSMSMEFLTWPHMEGFFEDEADKYRYNHLVDAIEFLPYGITVDEFQHWVYAHPEASHEERCKKWREIEMKNTPHKKYDYCPTMNHGAYWLRQSHIFTAPFYYIDYTLAQVVAFEFLISSRKNYERTWKKYVKLCKMGGKYPFVKMLEVNHLRNPFIDGNVAKAIKGCQKIIKEIDISKYE